MRTFIALGAVTALLVACPTPNPGVDAGTPELDGGSGGGTDAGKPNPTDAGFDAGFGAVAAADWCAKKALAACLRDLRCLRLGAAFLPQCLTAAQVTCDTTAYARGVAEGRLAYDAGAAGKCLDDYGTGACDGDPITCEHLFQGKVPPDGGCTIAEECNRDGFCFLYDNVCPHTCRPVAERGEACNTFDRVCRGTDGCELVDAGQVACVAKRDAGAPCIYYSGCGTNMACNSGFCIESRVGEGAGCNVAGGYPFCDVEHFCRQEPPPAGGGPQPPGTCERKSGVGGTCSPYDSCLPSLRCSGLITTGRCTGKAAVGESCAQYGECQDQLFCNPNNGKCTPLPGDGGDCTAQGSFFTCAAGYWCDFTSPTADYRCLGKQPLGAACSYDQSCLSNDCVYGALSDGGFGARCSAPCSQLADGGL